MAQVSGDMVPSYLHSRRSRLRCATGILLSCGNRTSGTPLSRVSRGAGLKSARGMLVWLLQPTVAAQTGFLPSAIRQEQIRSSPACRFEPHLRLFTARRLFHLPVQGRAQNLDRRPRRLLRGRTLCPIRADRTEQGGLAGGTRPGGLYARASPGPGARSKRTGARRLAATLPRSALRGLGAAGRHTDLELIAERGKRRVTRSGERGLSPDPARSDTGLRA